MNTALVGTTTRPITFGITSQDTVVRHIETLPAGTEVYVTRIKGHLATVRICGTLLTQRVVLANSIVPA